MWVGIISLFPEMFRAVTQYGITGRACREGLMELEFINPRDFTTDRHRTVDDRPYGGGPGMLMQTGPLAASIEAAKLKAPDARVIYLSPQGTPLDQGTAGDLAAIDSVILLCGRYEGIDERIVRRYVDMELSLGDFVLSGGELAAMALLDAMTRLQPGALGDAESAQQDSFMRGLLDHPHYTRPETFAGMSVPPVLLSGDHARIEDWRLQQRLGRTWERRPDLLEKQTLTPQEQTLLDAWITQHQRVEEDE